MIRLSDIIQEKSKAHQDAEELGLDYYQFGRYGKGGKTTHKNVGGKLVPVDQSSPPTVTTPADPSSKKSSKLSKIKPIEWFKDSQKFLLNKFPDHRVDISRYLGEKMDKGEYDSPEEIYREFTTDYARDFKLDLPDVEPMTDPESDPEEEMPDLSTVEAKHAYLDGLKDKLQERYSFTMDELKNSEALRNHADFLSPSEFKGFADLFSLNVESSRRIKKADRLDDQLRDKRVSLIMDEVEPWETRRLKLDKITDRLRKIDKYKHDIKTGAEIKSAETLVRAFRAGEEVRPALRDRDYKLNHATKEYESRIQKFIELMPQNIRKRFGSPRVYTIQRQRRAIYKPRYREVNIYNPSIPGFFSDPQGHRIWHELGHHVEEVYPEALIESLKFYKKRTAGKNIELLKDRIPVSGYEDNEVIRDGNFGLGEYVGKEYTTTMLKPYFNAPEDEIERDFYPRIKRGINLIKGQVEAGIIPPEELDDSKHIRYHTASEIFSMGMEQLLKNSAEFLEKDPEHFEVIQKILRGIDNA